MVYALGCERYIASLDGIRSSKLYIWIYLKQLLYHVLIDGIWDIDDLLSLTNGLKLWRDFLFFIFKNDAALSTLCLLYD